MEASERNDIIRCPACGADVPRDEAAERSRQDPVAELTCPVCGAGLDSTGGLEHEPVIGP